MQASRTASADRTSGKGRVMTTANRVEKPGWVIPIQGDEFEDFETEATAFLDGDRDEAKFIGFRLKQGVYGQRQAARQMMRVKLPFGGVSADQLDAFGELAERFTPLGKGHITTRQNFQFHHIPLARTPEALRLLGHAGLSTREACGNVVRNVTGDAWAGIRSDEPFDITPYAGAFVRYWVRNEITQLLPRKFKVTFSGSDRDDAWTAIHDIGLLPRIREIDGQQVRGFKMVVGGGLSTMAKEAVVVREFCPVDEYLKVSEAILRVFNEADELRKNLAKARLKFLVHRVGEEAFREMIDEELKQDWAQHDITPDALLYLDDEAADAPSLMPTVTAQPNGDEAEFEAWRRASLMAQKQEGYYAIEVQVPQGDLTPEQFRGVAHIIRTYSNGRARTTQWQNLVLRWIPELSLYSVWKDLQALGLGSSQARQIEDVVSCPGTDSCKLGITSSMGLNRAIVERLGEMAVEDELTREMLINASGCPNSCGMHHIGNIGFHGAAIKSADGERQLPAYNVFVGGSRQLGQQLRIGTLLKLKIPAKRAPDVVERLVAMYQRDRNEGERFNDFADRMGREPFEDELRDLTIAPDFKADTMQEFIDWEREGLYVLERGEGECAV